MPGVSLAVAALVCLAYSTQLLFQRDLYDTWSIGEIAAEWARQLGNLLIIAATILGVLACVGRLRARRAWPKVLLFVTGIFLGSLLGESIVVWLAAGAAYATDYGVVMPRGLRWVPLAMTCGAAFLLYRRSTDMASRLHDVTVARIEAERQAIESQLALLQSQIEPHFLFNTLATIRRLHQTDFARGRATLAGFIHYLRSSLPAMRERETELWREVDLIAAYLDVLGARMGSRLRTSIEIPDEARDCLLPPLSLATLVENAIKHGLNPLPEGGTLSIEAQMTGGQLAVSVTDTGAGLRAAGGSGSGLANLRARLDALYGGAASVTLAANHPRGLAATLRVPAAHPDPRRDR